MSEYQSKHNPTIDNPVDDLLIGILATGAVPKLDEITSASDWYKALTEKVKQLDDDNIAAKTRLGVQAIQYQLEINKLKAECERLRLQIAECDAKLDYEYALGLKAGWNFCANNDSNGIDGAVSSRLQAIKDQS